MRLAPLPHALILPAVQNALREDLGDAGDITSAATVPADAKMTAVVTARKAGRIAGLDLAETAFREMDPGLSLTHQGADGTDVEPGAALLTVKGNARAILAAERTALNFLGRLSGIATATAAFAKAIEGTGARITCTRKTTPGLRAFEKYAVRCGGGVNHRFGLYDAVLIKDNHIAAAGSVAAALQGVRDRLGHTVKVEIEVDTLAQLEEVLAIGADIIMLDNFSNEDLREAVARAKGKAVLEASGNVTLDTVRAIAETGVGVISSGWITHSAPNFDVGLDVVSS